MRDLADFSLPEWLRLVPLQQAFKQVRDDLRLRWYLGSACPELAGFLADTRGLTNRNIALTVAFEQPWMIDWQLRMARRNLPDVSLLVFDNSRTADARTRIRDVCHARNVPYLPLPPYRTRHVNRSHGFAMSWIFHNVVRAIEPRIFGFIDHDLIPVVPVDWLSSLQGQPLYGMPWGRRDWGWQLWAGYCIFEFGPVRDLELNFLHDFSRGLDTGGRNWKPLYRQFAPERLRFAESRIVDFRIPPEASVYPIQLVDERWVHIGGVGYNDNFDVKETMCKALASALDAGIAWQELLVPGASEPGFH